MNKFSKKQRLAVMGMLALVLCLAMVNNSLNNEESMITSSEYTDYEREQMLEHDGDVLVDSLNVKSISEEQNKDDKTSQSGILSQIVTSDDISELANSEIYMGEIRATVDEDRNQIISMLTDVATEAENAAEKENAMQQKMKIINYMEKVRTLKISFQLKDYQNVWY